jgi:hypothetical protein
MREIMSKTAMKRPEMLSLWRHNRRILPLKRWVYRGFARWELFRHGERQSSVGSAFVVDTQL